MAILWLERDEDGEGAIASFQKSVTFHGRCPKLSAVSFRNMTYDWPMQGHQNLKI